MRLDFRERSFHITDHICAKYRPCRHTECYCVTVQAASGRLVGELRRSIAHISVNIQCGAVITRSKSSSVVTMDTLRARPKRHCHSFPGRLHWLFACINSTARRKSSAGKPIFCKFCVYFPSRMQGTCVSVASVLRGMRATPGDGAWKLRIRCGQHM